MVGVVVYAEPAAKAEQLRFPTENPGGQRVEGTDPEACGVTPKQLAHPPAHLRSAAVRKRDREDLLRRNPVLLHQMGDTRGQHTGLPGTGSCQNEGRSTEILHGFPLRIVEM